MEEKKNLIEQLCTISNENDPKQVTDPKIFIDNVNVIWTKKLEEKESWAFHFHSYLIQTRRLIDPEMVRSIRMNNSIVTKDRSDDTTVSSILKKCFDYSARDDQRGTEAS